MEFRVLGPVEVRRDGESIVLSGTKVKTVLAALLLARGRVVSDAQLSRLLWGWNPPVTVSAQIYTYISRLRMRLGDDVRIARQLPGYALDAGDARIDFLEFERLSRLGTEAQEAGDVERAGALLQDALELWRGPALSNVTEFLADTELPRLEEARAVALEHRIEADLELGRHRGLIPELTSLVSEFPVRERMRAQLMKALYQCGRQADALTAYHAGRRVLADELGVDPGAELAAVYQAVLTGDPAVAPPARAAVARTAPPSTLPADIPEFTGRRAELAELGRLLPPAGGRSWHTRRFLVTGMPGIGKTALAVRAANESLDAFPDGRLYVNLSRPDGRPADPRDVLVGMLRSLGEPMGTGESDLDELVRRYRTRTTGRRILILLDNAVSELQLSPLLPGAPEPGVLITSQTLLGPIGGLHTRVLGPLSTQESLQMLTASADPARVAAEPQAARDIARYCAGLPLALRIVATRLAARPSSSLRRFADRLAQPHGRLRELEARGLSVPRSLEAALGRLDGEQRRLLLLLPRLGREEFSVRSAARSLGLGAAPLEAALESLVDQGLLGFSDGPDEPVYRLNSLVRLVAETSRHAREAERSAA
ncbi:BTAD domain-containing putative transcriptional regulator [Streptomyces coelicoflavus]|uniref:AfsR/SARP family transcriptional regulator n=1 Tax=Streptomyces coelicoflavus TaxID=285562 RepID=UPI0024AD9682|nr:BTAD domain-containing putative transcriptional regulator [Streptomyces coelicoflavus]MDI6521583.1 BTAD domain-containing putative transcriptional regulator [Streptomyces coelicoflavus]